MNKTIQKPAKSHDMLDLLVGTLSYVIDHKTFAMKVTHIGTHNVYRYNDTEVIEIALINNSALMLNQIGNKTRLFNILSGRTIRCNIVEKNIYNRLVSNIEIS